MRLLFFGSGAFGLPTLQRLHGMQQVCAVVSQPDRPAGRQQRSTPTPITRFAQAAGLPTLLSEQVNAPEFVERIKALRLDAAVVIAFGQKLSPELIAGAGRLVVNLHASLLPKYRGAAPINHAILNGDTRTGVSVISLSERMDAGLIYAQAQTPIDPLETAGELHDRLAVLGPAVVERVLADFAAGKLLGRPQDETQVTQAGKLSKADAWVDFQADARIVATRVQGLTPWPGVKVLWRRQAGGEARELILRRVAAQPGCTGTANQPAPGLVLEDYAVAVRDGGVRLLEVQLPGGRPLTIAEFVRGHPLRPGDSLLRGS